MSDTVRLVDPNAKEKASPAKKEVKTDDIPMGYAPISLCTKGRLDAPKKLHIRDYTLEETTELASIREENYLYRLITILNRMVYEDFDCGNLHIEEMKQILLTVHANFWSASLSGMPYKIDEDGEGDKSNIGTTDIPISSIDVKDIDTEFKEPIVITSKSGNVAKFRLPRVTDVQEANAYIEKKFEAEEHKFVEAKLFVESQRGTGNIDVTMFKKPDLLLEYLDYLQAKDAEYNIVHRSLRLREFNGEKTDTIEQKLSFRSKIDMTMWSDLNWVINKYAFGVQPEVEFFSEIKGEKIIRRFQFRTLDFIPNMALQTDSRNAISFGD